MKQMLHQRMFESGSYKEHPEYAELYDALEKSMSRDNMDALHEELSKKRKRRYDEQDPPSSPNDDDQDSPPPPPRDSYQSKKRRYDSDASGSTQPPSKDSEQSTKKKLDSDASAAQQPPAHTSFAWKITDTKDAPSSSLMHMSEPQSEQFYNDTPTPDDMRVSDPEDVENAHILKVQDTTTLFRPIPEEERPASPEPEWVIPPIDLPEANNNWANALAKTHQDPDENKLHNKIDDIGSYIRWYCGRKGKEELSKADLEGPAFMMVKGFHENNITLQFQMEECHKLLTNQVDLFNPEGHRIVPDISKLLPLGGPPGQIESEREYNISAAYGITHWWFRRKQFYINKHSKPSDHDAVRSHMRILNVISIKTYERYGYNNLREIVLRRANNKDYKISEKDFKNLHPNDFEDLNILHIQGKLDHLPKQDKLGIKSYKTKLNLEQPNWDASDFPFKEDYIIVFKPRAVIYKDTDENRKMMRINEVHKFSDGTLTRIKEKLDFMVKDFKLFKFNKGMENRK
ncbi:hypothetical protein Tco_0936541 [Tanacetum coccineum]